MEELYLGCFMILREADLMSSTKGDQAEVGRRFTPHKIKFDIFKFKALEELEIDKAIYEHTEVKLKGVIDEANVADYERYLAKQEPKLVINYGEKGNKILFKGIITDYKFVYKKYDYYLTLKAVSYSILLKQIRRNRIFQNLGTTYNEVFDKLMQDNPKFHLAFADDAMGEMPLVSKEYPLVLQYKENDWDFLKRITSYLNKILIVDDMKDIQEGVNILVGAHPGAPKELNNVSGGKAKKTGRKNNKFDYYKIYGHENHRSEDIFDIGKKINYKVNNQTKKKLELIILKNRIYLQDSILCSDLTLAKQEAINLLKEKRKVPIEGRSFRAKVKKLNQDHTAKVKFIDITNKYIGFKAFNFPIDRLYTEAYFAPEKGDIVDIYFKGKNEKYATLKSSSTDNQKRNRQLPEDKEIITPNGYRIKMNNESLLISGKDEKSLMEIKEELIKVISTKGTIEMTPDLINMKRKDGAVLMDDAKTEVEFGGKKMKVNNSGIDMS